MPLFFNLPPDPCTLCAPECNHLAMAVYSPCSVYITGRVYLQASAQAQAQAQAQTQAQTSEETANTVKALIAGVSSLASVVKTALAPAGSTPATPVPAAQQTVRPLSVTTSCDGIIVHPHTPRA